MGVLAPLLCCSHCRQVGQTAQQTSCDPTQPVQAGVFAETFSRLNARGMQPGVLYPAVAIPSAADLAAAEAGWHSGLPSELARFCKGGPTFLSINRFERKKVRVLTCW